MNRSLATCLTLSWIAFSSAPLHAQVYRCTVDGRTVFSDQPCAEEGNVQEVRIFDHGPSAEDAAAARARANALRERTAAEQAQGEAQREFNRQVTNAIAARRVLVGMTADDVRRSWGEPGKINRSVSGSSVREQWVYDRGNYRMQYVYLTNGEVTGIQSPNE